MSKVSEMYLKVTFPDERQFNPLIMEGIIYEALVERLAVEGITVSLSDGTFDVICTDIKHYLPNKSVK